MSLAAETVSTKPKILPLFFTQASMNFFMPWRWAFVSSVDPGAPGVVPYKKSSVAFGLRHLIGALRPTPLGSKPTTL